MNKTFQYHKSLSLLLFLFSLCGLLFLYFRAQEGFTPREIISLIEPALIGKDPPLEDQEKLPSIFKEKFYYLGKGCQFYVFESEDGAHVLKFFKHKHLWPSLLQSEKREERIKRLFSSVRLAYTHLREETGLLAIHLEKKKIWDRPLILVDKLGFEHSISLNNHEFILQKKAVPAHRSLDEIESILTLIERCLDKGVQDLDKATWQNFGFIDGKAIYLDMGQFTLADKLDKKNEMERRKKSLYHSLE